MYADSNRFAIDRLPLPPVVCLFLFLFATACIDSKLPDSTSLGAQDRTYTDLPDITLTRMVIPQYTKKEVGAIFQWQTEEISSSKFGDPYDIANLDCVVDGLRASIQNVEIYPTDKFWSDIAVSDEKMKLTELFESPVLERWQQANLDILVVAYHEEIDVEMIVSELGTDGGYFDTNREKAAMLVIDLHNQSLLRASVANFEDTDGVAHVLFVIPLVLITTAVEDPCEMVGKEAGKAIGNSAAKSSLRIVVVASENNPYPAALKTAWAEASERKRQKLESQCSISFPQVLSLDAVTLSDNASFCKDVGYPLDWQWLCLAAHRGNPEAQYEMSRIFEKGKGPIAPNFKLAYVWGRLASLNGYEEKHGYDYRKTESGEECCFPNYSRITDHLGTEEISEAERIVVEWKPNPAECEAITAQ